MTEPDPGSPDAGRTAPSEHEYLSTYCIHGDCTNCRLTCKICKASCVCPCHAGLVGLLAGASSLARR
jgi:hypothetical protein